MTALAQDRDRNFKEGLVISYKVKASQTIYKGALLAVDATGYALPASDTAGMIFIGIAKEAVDNSAGASGAKRVQVYVTGIHAIALASVAITDLWAQVFVTDSDTVTKTGTNKVRVGSVVGVLATNWAWVKIDGAFPILGYAHISDPAACDAMTAVEPAACDAATQGTYTASTTLTNPPTKAEMEAELALIDAELDKVKVDVAACITCLGLHKTQWAAAVVDFAALTTNVGLLNAAIDSINAALAASGITAAS